MRILFAALHVYTFYVCLRFYLKENSVSVRCGWHRTAYAVCIQRIFSKIMLRWCRGDELLNKVVIFVFFVLQKVHVFLFFLQSKYILRKTFQDFFLHIVDFNGNQWFEASNCSFSAASKGSKQHQPRNKGLIKWSDWSFSHTKKVKRKNIYFLTTNAHLALAGPDALRNRTHVM